MTAVTDLITNIMQYRASADSSPIVCDADLLIAALLELSGGSGPVSAITFTHGTQIVETSNGVLTLLDSTGLDFGRLNFGGVTEDYPAISRNGVAINIVQGDNGDFTNLRSNQFQASSVLSNLVESITFVVDNATPVIVSSVNLANNAGAAAGSLTNAPTAGNPTKWIAINDNGTIRKIPTWL